MVIQVKICGIASGEAGDAAIRAGADYLGFVFHPGSPRNLDPYQAHALSARFKGKVRLVALLVDPDDDMLLGVTTVLRPDFVQLHGKETPARTGAIRARVGLPIIKSFAIAEASDFAAVPAYTDAADAFLFDARPPQGATRPGGHGAAFDWQLLRGRRFPRPWFLAGGLEAGNVARAINLSGAPGVDVSSGVETAPGIKSPDMIRAFVEAARNAHYATETEA